MDVARHACASLVPRPMRVVGTTAAPDGTVTLELAAGDFAFEPGQFVMVSRPGVGEVPISISGDPDERDTLMLTIRPAGLATEAMCATKPGSWLGIRGPYGTRWPDVVAGDLLLMAGGLGLAPLRGAFLRALRATDRIRRVVLLYGTREPRTILFAEELRRWAGETRADVRVTVDAAAPGWTGNVGLITSLLGRDLVDAARTTALVCGPEVMMRFAARHLGTLGVPMSRVHVSLERHMACGTAQCGRCQLGPLLLCRDGPVVPYADVARELSIAEL